MKLRDGRSHGPHARYRAEKSMSKGKGVLTPVRVMATTLYVSPMPLGSCSVPATSLDSAASLDATSSWPLPYRSS